MSSTSKTIKRLALIGFFIGLNVVLGRYFLREYKVYVPESVAQLAERFGFDLPSTADRHIPLQTKEVKIQPSGVLALVNKEREKESTPALQEHPELTKVAQLILQEFSKSNFEIDKPNFTVNLESLMKQTTYDYSSVSDIALVGPITDEEVVQAWLENPDQMSTMLDGEFTQAGVATTVTQIDGHDAGATVLVLAEPRTLRKIVTGQSREIEVIDVKPTVRTVSDMEVVEALNTYRTAHHVPALVVNDHLCVYAQKRADDLRAAGGLDGHEGFKKDFENGNVPVGIKDYAGGQIGENLASQFCKNGTTGQTFVANTGTALIEWCFDSSTSGHREAQLNPAYTAVCVKHSDTNYVVIFGE
jgi:uncharacterized protein YkwD